MTIAITVNTEIVGIVFSAGAVRCREKLCIIGTEIIRICADTVVDTEMGCTLGNRQLVCQIVADSVAIAGIGIGFHHVAGELLPDKLIIWISICSRILEELDMDVVPYDIAVAVEGDFLMGGGVAFRLLHR